MDDATSLLQSTVEASTESFLIHFPQHDGPATSYHRQFHDLGERLGALAESQRQEPPAEVVAIRGREQEGGTDAQSLFLPAWELRRGCGTLGGRFPFLQPPPGQGHDGTFCGEEVDAFRVAGERIHRRAFCTVLVRSRLVDRPSVSGCRPFPPSPPPSRASPGRCCCFSSSSTSFPVPFRPQTCAAASFEALLSRGFDANCSSFRSSTSRSTRFVSGRVAPGGGGSSAHGEERTVPRKGDGAFRRTRAGAAEALPPVRGGAIPPPHRTAQNRPAFPERSSGPSVGISPRRTWGPDRT
eukprot:scaffold350_cov333-Pavlova_lutheri.AAC.5